MSPVQYDPRLAVVLQVFHLQRKHGTQSRQTDNPLSEPPQLAYCFSQSLTSELPDDSYQGTRRVLHAQDMAVASLFILEKYYTMSAQNFRHCTNLL